MTQSGEQLTPKGEFGSTQESVFAFQKSVAISYSIDIERRNSMEINIFNSDGSPASLFQMIFVTKGKLVFAQKGSNSGIAQIESQQHNLCCIEPASTQMLLDSPSDEVICINLSSAFLERYLPGGHPVWQQLKGQSSGQTPQMLAELNMHLTPEISAILQRLEQTSHNGFCGQLLLEAKVIELLALQIAQFELLTTAEKPLSLKKEDLDRMHEVREILIHHTGEQLSLRSLAHLVGTNEFNLKRNFKIAFGTTVYGYLNQYKMEQAKSLLIEKNLTVAEVSLKMGYKYATHFSTAFKKYFGYLPNKIRAGKLSLLLFIEGNSAVYENIGLLLGL